MDEDIVRKTYRAEIKEVNANEGMLDLMIPISTSAVDRDGEVIEPSAFKKTIPKFMKHPVLVASHDYRDLTHQIGEWTKLKVQDEGVEGMPKYYINEGNPEADWAFNLASKGVAAFSIGFIPKVWEDGDNEKAPRRTYKEIELLEISQVIIPSNREAIQSMRSKSVNEPVIQELCDEVEAQIDEEKKEIVLKPEETDEFIRIPVGTCEVTATIDISKKEGISALYCGKEKQVRTYLFRKDKGWTMSSAKAWVEKHGKSSTYQCIVCGEYFIDSPSANRKTCSQKCHYEYLSKLNSGENHPQYKGGKEKVICEQCGKIFEVHRRGNSQKYCSVECHNEAMRIDKEIGTCPICNKKFSYYVNNPQIYCSRECFHTGQKEYLKEFYKTHELTESQKEALGDGRLNRFGGYQTECDDGHIVQSKSESDFDNWLSKEGINHNIQVRVCDDRYWTCDFVLIRDDDNTLWVEIDGLGELREEFGGKQRFEEKLNYYKNSKFNFLVIDKGNTLSKKNEILAWVKEHEGKSLNIEHDISQKEIMDEIDYLKVLIKNAGMNNEVTDSLNSLLPAEEDKTGAVLNKKNKDRLNQIKSLAQAVLDSAGVEEEEKREIEGEEDIIQAVFDEIQNVHFEGYKFVSKKRYRGKETLVDKI